MSDSLAVEAAASHLHDLLRARHPWADRPWFGVGAGSAAVYVYYDRRDKLFGRSLPAEVMGVPVVRRPGSPPRIGGAT